MGKVEAWNWPEDHWIPAKDCIDGHLYWVAARHGVLGVYRAKDNAFIISRIKFDRNYLFPEYHWENPRFATAQPLEDLGPVCSMNDEALLKFLNEEEIRLDMERKMLKRLIERGKRVLCPEKPFGRHHDLLEQYLKRMNRESTTSAVLG